MLGFKKARKSPTQQVSWIDHQPIMVVVGSMQSSSRNDVLAYARGIADSQVVAKDACFVDATKHDDQWIYEIHEGGPGRSIGPWLMTELSRPERTRVSLPLTANRVATVARANEEIITIIHPPSEEKHAQAVEDASDLVLHHQLTPLLGQATGIKRVASACLVGSALLFFSGGIAFFTSSNAINVERYAARFAAINPTLRTEINQLPSVQLSKATESIATKSGYLSYLKLEKGKWTWAQVNAVAQAPISGEKSHE